MSFHYLELQERGPRMEQQIGRQLKEARERQGISLKSVQHKTKVSLRYLEAIESGAFHVIPGEFYLKGFIRSYARAVGVDPEELLAAYSHESPASEQPCSTPPQGLFARLAHGLRNGFFGGSHRYN